MALDFAATYKILLLGDSNVGKTCIVHRFCDERFYDTYISTIGVDFKQKIINLDGVPIKLQIWDTAGQERFRTLTTAYYRGAMGIILLYDVTNLESFNNIPYWIQNIEENASPFVETVIAGNKCESRDRLIDIQSGHKIAEHFNLPFLEISCKDNINVDEAFLLLSRKIREKREQTDYPFKEKNELKSDNEIQSRNCSSCFSR